MTHDHGLIFGGGLSWLADDYKEANFGSDFPLFLSDYSGNLFCKKLCNHIITNCPHEKYGLIDSGMITARRLRISLCCLLGWMVIMSISQ